MSPENATPELPTPEGAPTPEAPSAARPVQEPGGGDGAPRLRLTTPRFVAAMVVVLAVTALIRVPTFSFPMGQMAGTVGYVGRGWLSGRIPYRDAWDFQAPGLYLAAGLIIRTVRPDTLALRLTMLGLDLATLLLVYTLVRHWCTRIEALMAAAIFGVFSGGLLVVGDCLEPGPPMNFLFVLAFLALLRSEGRKLGWLVLCGLALGLAVTIRLTAVVYPLAVALWLPFTRSGSERRLARWGARALIVLVAAAVPFACFAAYFAAKGAWGDLVDGAILYNMLFRWLFGSRRIWGQNFRTLLGVIPEQGVLWFFAGGWLIHAYSVGFRRQTALVALWCVVAAAASVFTGRVDHTHFVQTVPPFAIAAALAVTNPSERLLRRDRGGRLETNSSVLILLTVVLLLGLIYTERRILRARSASRDLSTDRAAVAVARRIREHTNWREPIYVWGSRPQIYLLARRAAAHRFFYNWPLNQRPQLNYYFDVIHPRTIEDIATSLRRIEPVFIVTTHNYVREKERVRSLGEIGPLFEHIHDHYELWYIEDAEPYSFAVFIRDDRARIEKIPTLKGIEPGT